ncbi:MAG: hypothetical protein IT209_09620 [Armatimonadetes bacterium]|nr:hypothetical protein [Armatimonadota bacterium]
MNILQYRRTLSFSLIAVFGLALAAPMAAVASESGRRNTALALGAAALVLATKKNKTPALAAAVGAAVAYKQYSNEKNERQDREKWRRDRYGSYYDYGNNDRRDRNDYRSNDRRYDVYSSRDWYQSAYTNRDRYGNTYSSRDRFDKWAGPTVNYNARNRDSCDSNQYRNAPVGPPHGDYQGYYRDSRGNWVKKPVSIQREDRHPDNRNNRDHTDYRNKDRYDYRVVNRK